MHEISSKGKVNSEIHLILLISLLYDIIIILNNEDKVRKAEREVKA